MGETTGIGWTHHTFNGWRGCEHKKLEDGSPHPGCEHCYAEAMSRQNPRVLGRWGAGGTRVMGAKAYWRTPLKWNAAAQAAGERRRVFCQSLADVFEDWEGPIHSPAGQVLSICEDCGAIGDFEDDSCEECGSDDVPGLTMDDLRKKLFELIDHTPWLDWQLLTKRPELVMTMWPDNTRERTAELWGKPGGFNAKVFRPNVWLGTSVSNQQTADEFIPQLLRYGTFCPVLFASVEPLIGPVYLNRDLGGTLWIGGQRGHEGRSNGRHEHDNRCERGLSWVIVGGESGSRYRECQLEDLLDVARQCRTFGVPIFVKQDCGLKDGQQGRIPDYVWQVKQFPKVEV